VFVRIVTLDGLRVEKICQILKMTTRQERHMSKKKLLKNAIHDN
jgi:hypothetical protein